MMYLLDPSSQQKALAYATKLGEGITEADPEVRAKTTNLNPVWMSNYIQYKMWDKITYPFPNFNGATVEVWEWISNFILHFIGQVMVRHWTGDKSLL